MGQGLVIVQFEVSTGQSVGHRLALVHRELRHGAQPLVGLFYHRPGGKQTGRDHVAQIKLQLMI